MLIHPTQTFYHSLNQSISQSTELVLYKLLVKKSINFDYSQTNAINQSINQWINHKLVNQHSLIKNYINSTKIFSLDPNQLFAHCITSRLIDQSIKKLIDWATYPTLTYFLYLFQKLENEPKTVKKDWPKNKSLPATIDSGHFYQPSTQDSGFLLDGSEGGH